MIQVVPNEPPKAMAVNCPRAGCGTVTELNTFSRLRTHKLPDGWRTCAASGQPLREASEMEAPKLRRPRFE